MSLAGSQVSGRSGFGGAPKASHLATEAAGRASRTLLPHWESAFDGAEAESGPAAARHFDIQHSHIETDRMDAEQTAERLGAQSPSPRRELFRSGG